jgi:hypothetical protein
VTGGGAARVAQIVTAVQTAGITRFQAAADMLSTFPFRVFSAAKRVEVPLRL